jgi:ribosome assembly protein 1
VQPIPENVTDFLVKNGDAVKRVYDRGAKKDDESEEIVAEADVAAGNTLSVEDFKKQLKEKLEGGKGRDIWKDSIDKIVAFGPRRTGPNLLIDATADGIFSKAFATEKTVETAPRADESLHPSHLTDKISYAFQLATAQGPLCNEPLQGVAVFIEDVTLNLAEDDSSARDKLGRLTGEIIRTFQSSLRAGFMDWSPRLMLAMYSVEIQASTEVLGRVYDVLTRRRGRVNAELMKEGTPFFTIQALVPVAESFGFADEMRKRTSGAAQPQLIFAGFEILDEDPFWVPFTEDDLEDLGELADKENVAKRYMDGVRRKKGLLVEGRNVATDAEKQKTLKR